MRKLLLTSTVILGASLGVAHASDFTSTAGNGPSTLTPGQMVVHITLRSNFYFAASGSSATSYKGNKQQPYATLGYNRLYLGVDGMAANGLKYGTSMEIRENFETTGAGSGASGDSSTNTLFFRRAYVYAGTDQAGIFRFGQTDGPTTLLLLGTFEGFNDGGWNGDAFDGVPSAVQPTWAWPDVGNVYASTKIEYLSPNLAGFDFGISFEPNDTSEQDGSCYQSSAGFTGCATQSTSTSTTDQARRRNTIEVAGRYRGNFGGFGVAAEAGYIGSGVINNATGPNEYVGLSQGNFGLELSYAGVTVGGNVIGGDGNAGWALQPKGGAHEIAWIAGAQYTTGPIIVGASYFNVQSQGAAGSLLDKSQRSETGIAAGGTYSVAPGLVVFLSYLYGTRHQGDYDFLASAVGPDNNDVKSQIISLGTQFKW